MDHYTSNGKRKKVKARKAKPRFLLVNDRHKMDKKKNLNPLISHHPNNPPKKATHFIFFFFFSLLINNSKFRALSYHSCTAATNPRKRNRKSIAKTPRRRSSVVHVGGRREDSAVRE